ncbi:division/cell wall cluster transcriptional repressor MraZ [Desulfoferrobacter suflitae]|uniref:division/cell wall cluster transcriptional repressor MraZ n=1 Tax=Desulfoferrobacter suflitae TaxID=2865782 RepID=UPI002164B3E3|nr:division/cell wall cluster transcriptional repressor MraZ [Desulfoferrobacter suflitae]MCK8600415.1 division/cell wall cluster transcriptional repressor MraZ [Desulfoferrobacter suflitae]
MVKSGGKGAKVGILGKPYFRGQSINRLDSKGRLRIPVKFRDVLQNHYTDGLIITVMEKCLVAYPPEIWDKIENKVLNFSQVQPEQRAFMRFFISSAVECEFDKQGRILIPPVLRERAKLHQEVLIAGMLTSFEIWDKETWEQQMEWDTEHYQQIATHIADIGL